MCGFCADKNVSDCLNNILCHVTADRMRVINSSHPRSMKAERLREVLKTVNEKMGRKGEESRNGERG